MMKKAIILALLSCCSLAFGQVTYKAQQNSTYYPIQCTVNGYRVCQLENKEFGYINAKEYPHAKIRFIIEAISQNVIVARYEVTTSGKTCFDVADDIKRILKNLK